MEEKPMTAPSRLVGLWRLVSYTERGPSGETAHVFGEGAKGYLSYLADGRMMVLVTGAGRPRLRGAWDAVAATDKAAAYDKLIAYAGRYSEYRERVVHHVELCWIPNWEGRELERLVIPQAEDRMILRTPAERPPVQDLLWERLG
jgi:hypothetical protein